MPTLLRQQATRAMPTLIRHGATRGIPILRSNRATRATPILLSRRATRATPTLRSRPLLRPRAIRYRARAATLAQAPPALSTRPQTCTTFARTTATRTTASSSRWLRSRRSTARPPRPPRGRPSTSVRARRRRRCSCATRTFRRARSSSAEAPSRCASAASPYEMLRATRKRWRKACVSRCRSSASPCAPSTSTYAAARRGRGCTVGRRPCSTQRSAMRRTRRCCRICSCALHSASSGCSPQAHSPGSSPVPPSTSPPCRTTSPPSHCPSCALEVPPALRCWARSRARSRRACLGPITACSHPLARTRALARSLGPTGPCPTGPSHLTPAADTDWTARTPPPLLPDPSLRDRGHITVLPSARLSWDLASPRSRTSSMLVVAVHLAAEHGRRVQGACAVCRPLHFVQLPGTHPREVGRSQASPSLRRPRPR